VLGEKQQRFVDEYLVDMNATQAAIRAGYSVRTAHAQGCRLLKHADVARAIAKAKENLSKRTGISQEWVIERLVAEAQYEGPGASHGARVAAAAHLAKHLGMFVERQEVRNLTLEDVIAKARKSA